jgi:hypothetical protein
MEGGREGGREDKETVQSSSAGRWGGGLGTVFKAIGSFLSLAPLKRQEERDVSRCVNML